MNLEPFHGLSHSWTCPVCCLNPYKIFYLYVTSDFIQILPGWRVLFFQVIVFNNFSHGNSASWIWSFLLLFSDLSLFLFWNRGPQLQSVVKMQADCGFMLRNNYVLWLFFFPFLIISSVDFAFLIDVEHWVSKFLEICISTPWSTSWEITVSLEPIILCGKLGLNFGNLKNLSEIQVAYIILYPHDSW